MIIIDSVDDLVIVIVGIFGCFFQVKDIDIFWKNL